MRDSREFILRVIRIRESVVGRERDVNDLIRELLNIKVSRKSAESISYARARDREIYFFINSRRADCARAFTKF